MPKKQVNAFKLATLDTVKTVLKIIEKKKKHKKQDLRSQYLFLN